MELFKILGQTLEQQEARTAYFSWDAKVWPSEASAELLDQRVSKVIGKCQRAVYFRLTGEPIVTQTDFKKALTFWLGKEMEGMMSDLAKAGGIFVAAGVRHHIQDIDQTLEIDLVVIDPETWELWIVENKTTANYYANQEVIKKGNVKKEAVMQLCMYLSEFGRGDVLKEVIQDAYEKKKALEARKLELQATGNEGSDEYIRLVRDLSRNRIEVDFDNLNKGLDFAAVRGKICYETRDTCETREYTVEIHTESGPDGEVFFPVVDGKPFHHFTLNSIFERFEKQRWYHERAKAEAMRRLREQGISMPPESAHWGEVHAYRERVGQQMRALEPDWWAPAEYEWRYSKAKVEFLLEEEVGLTEKQKKAVKMKSSTKGYQQDWPGDWQCRFCEFRLKCLPVEYPEFRYLLADAYAQALAETEGEAA